MSNITLPRATVEQALEALEWSWGGEPMGTLERDAITALRAALAQQAEPVTVDAAYQKWLEGTHAPALRRMDSQGAFAAGWQAALAQQAEPVGPVAWMESPHGAIRANPLYKIQFPSQLLSWQIPLYTAPPQRKPLTEGVLMGAYMDFDRKADKSWSSAEYLLAWARAIERAHGIGEKK